MPNRIIKESVCTSETIDRLSWFEEVVFYRLIVTCDDYGRFDARPAILRSRLFPLKSVTDKQVESAINMLRTVGIVEVYKYDDRPYLQLRTWDKHQTIRAKRSKYPEPQADEIICNHMQADASRCSRNPIQSESVSESISESESNARVTAFSVFWNEYPKKVGKGEAKKSFAKIPTALHGNILAAVREQKNSQQWQKEGGRYIPNPATWLNQERWDDEPTEQASGNIFADLVKEGALK